MVDINKIYNYIITDIKRKNDKLLYNMSVFHGFLTFSTFVFPQWLALGAAAPRQLVFCAHGAASPHPGKTHLESALSKSKVPPLTLNCFEML